MLRSALVYYVRTAADLKDVRACFITNTAMEMLPQDIVVSRAGGAYSAADDGDLDGGGAAGAGGRHPGPGAE